MCSKISVNERRGVENAQGRAFPIPDSALARWAMVQSFDMLRDKARDFVSRWGAQVPEAKRNGFPCILHDMYSPAFAEHNNLLLKARNTLGTRARGLDAADGYDERFIAI
jgi:hypothetical protein